MPRIINISGIPIKTHGPTEPSSATVDAQCIWSTRSSSASDIRSNSSTRSNGQTDEPTGAVIPVVPEYLRRGVEPVQPAIQRGNP